MAVIPRLIDRYAIIFYAIGVLGALLYMWAAMQAQRKQGQALFSLEREDAADQSRRSWLMAVVCVLLMAGVYSVSSFVIPRLPAEEPVEETPMLALLITPSAVPTAALLPTATLAPTATFTPAPTIAPTATSPGPPPATPVAAMTEEAGQGGLAPACSSAGTQILSPSNGDQLSGVVEILGTASLPAFSFYKFEIQWPGTQTWVTLQTYNEPVAGGLLGIWDTAPLAGQPGTYGFRLVVVDSTGNFPDPCSISVVIE